MKKNKKPKWTRKWHQFFFFFLRIVVVIFVKIFYKYKFEPVRIKKKQKYIIICNHQATLDPIFLGVAFNRLPYFVANDDLLHIKYASWWLSTFFGIIPKSKGKSDYKTVKTMLQVLKENGSVALFPEGNRTFTGELCYINPAIIKFIKSAKTDVLIYNIEGGYGVDPRWSRKLRKGKLKGRVRKILSYNEIDAMNLEELEKTIKKSLNVFEAPSINEYNSKYRAEHIERVLYICPECKKKNTIISKGTLFTCTSCNTTWEYTKNLTIFKDKVLYKYKTVYEWYKMQLSDVTSKIYEEDEVIFTDLDIKIFVSKGTDKKVLLDKGKAILTNKEIKIIGNDSHTFNLSEIEGLCASGKQQVMFRQNDSTYTIRNDEEKRNNFNPIKYVTTINHLKYNEEGKDEYFGI